VFLLGKDDLLNSTETSQQNPHLINISIDVNLALKQIGTGLSIAGRKFREFFIMVFPCSAEKFYDNLEDHLKRELEHTQKILDERGIVPEFLRDLSDKFWDAWIKNAPLEDEENLQKMWATLLANAMDPNFDGSSIRITFTTIIREFSPLDVRILSHFYENRFQVGEKRRAAHVASILDTEQKYVDVSIHNLMRLGLLSILIINETVEIMGHPSLSGSLPYITPLGIDFVNACIES
jgi:hypothetical protein